MEQPVRRPARINSPYDHVREWSVRLPASMATRTTTCARAGASYGRCCPLRFWRAWAGQLRNGPLRSVQLRTGDLATGRPLKLRQGGASGDRGPRPACMRGACVRSAQPRLPSPQHRQARPALQPSTPSFLQGRAWSTDAYLRPPARQFPASVETPRWTPHSRHLLGLAMYPPGHRHR